MTRTQLAHRVLDECRDKKTVTIVSTAIGPETLAKLDAACEQRGCTRYRLLKDIVTEWCGANAA